MQATKLTIYTAYHSSRPLQKDWFGNTTRYRVTHAEIQAHEFHLCRVCQQRNKISLSIMVILAMISVGGLALLPSIQANTLHGLVVVLSLAGLLAALLVYARWGDAESKVKKEAILFRTNGGPGLNLVALSQKEYERLRRRATIRY